MRNSTETWDDYEKRCRNAREELADFPLRPRDPQRQLERLDAERIYKKALKALQYYLTERYGWGPGTNRQ